MIASHRLFASAFRAGRWTQSASSLGKVSPAALNQLVDNARKDFRRVLDAGKQKSSIAMDCP